MARASEPVTAVTSASIVSVSIWEACSIFLASFLIGLWVVLKRVVKWACLTTTPAEVRDIPPACLIDSVLGQHNYVKLKGVKFHYVEAGSRHYPLLLLLHGFPDCWLTWRHQMPVLSEHFRVVALDLKGFGDSDKPLWRHSYRVDLILDELKQFILSLGVSKCTVIGHDLGAMLGWYLVHMEPQLVDKFFAISCPHPNVFWSALPARNSTLNTRWLSFLQWPFLPEFEAVKEDLKIVTEYHKHLQVNGTRNTYLDAYKYTFSRRQDWTGPLNYYRNLPFCRIQENCPQNMVPTVLITGNKDPVVHLESIVKSSDFCEKFQMKIVADAGHFPHQEQFQMLNEILLKYLNVYRSKNKDSLTRTDSSNSLKAGLMNRMFGAVSTTVKYGNSMLDSVQKKTSLGNLQAKLVDDITM